MGFAVQLGTVRLLGRFLADPTAVPAEVTDYVAEQMGTPDPSCLKGYMARRRRGSSTRRRSQQSTGTRDCTAAEAELAQQVDDLSVTFGSVVPQGPRR